MESGLVSIVVVNWNTRELTRRCMHAVRRHTAVPYELIVVDNGSTDGSAEMLRGMQDDRTRVVLLPQNLGYAGGNNRGLLAARGDTLCLLNSDAFVTRGWLTQLLKTMQATGAGMVGPCTNRAAGMQRRRLWWGGFRPWFRPTRETDYLSFFCVLLRRQVFNKVGLLDEQFGLGTFEDNDYCRRAREAGVRLVVAGRSWVWHLSHATFDANGLDESRIRGESKVIYEKKWDAA